MRFRLTASGGAVLDEGTAMAEMSGGALVISPSFGQSLRVVPSDIVAISEPEPYVVRIALAEGPSIEMTQLGHMRTQILAELADARGDEVASTMLLGGVGTPECYSGSVDEAPAEIRLYDDALVSIPSSVSGGSVGEKVPYPFITAVAPDASGYRIVVSVAGREPLHVQRLARRTSDFTNLLTERWKAAAGRTSAFLSTLLPGLGPIALRSTSGLLRDGLAGSRTDLDAIDPTIWPALVSAAALPDRTRGLAALAQLGPLWIGFKQMVSVERAAEGGTEWTDSAVTPDLGDHDGGASSFGGGIGGMMGAAMMAGGPPRNLGFDGPFQTMGSALAVSMLSSGGSGFGGSGSGFGGSGFGGSGSGFGGRHQIQPRANVDRGTLTPAHTEPEALGTAGEQPTVLAYAFCRTQSGHVLYEVLNEPDHATYVYRAGDVAEINRALDLVGFRVAGIYTDADSAGSPYRKATVLLPALRILRDAYATRVIHTDDWVGSLDRALRP